MSSVLLSCYQKTSIVRCIGGDFGDVVCGQIFVSSGGLLIILCNSLHSGYIRAKGAIEIGDYEELGSTIDRYY